MNVIMLHSVGNNNSKWHQNWLSVSLEHFDNFCLFLNKNKYKTLFLEDWYNLQNKPKLIEKKHIVLTFDDGYLDNWVFASPILKKYDLKGTIFINPEFVEPSSNPRPTIEDVWNNKIDINNLTSLGFLNWSEIKQLDCSPNMDIQSHSMSHNYYFKSDQLIDFYNGQDDYHWLPWLERPDRKSYWMTENQKDMVPFGYPIFEYGRALGLRRFIPSDNFIRTFISEAQKIQTRCNHEKLDLLKKYTENFKINYGTTGRYETDEEMENRFMYDLADSKQILEEKLNKTVDFLCWPGGGYNSQSIKLSEEVGYKASTISSREKYKYINNTGAYKRIQRIGLNSTLFINNKWIYVKDKKYLVYLFLTHQNHFFSLNLFRAKKIYFKLMTKAGLFD